MTIDFICASSIIRHATGDEPRTLLARKEAISMSNKKHFSKSVREYFREGLLAMAMVSAGNSGNYELVRALEDELN